MLSMLFVGRLLSRVDARLPLTFGLLLSVYSLWWMEGFTLDVPSWDIAMSGVMQGFGVGFVWVSLTTVAFSTLPPAMRNEAAGVFNLMRNLGASVGISAVTALLTENTQTVHAALVGHVTPFNPLLQNPTVHHFWNPQSAAGLAALNAEATRQASMIAYLDDFKAIMLLTLLLVPLVLLITSPKSPSGAAVPVVD
jgi:DHA2 family multidrug resistance protein